jgi:hypothetical protein
MSDNRKADILFCSIAIAASLIVLVASLSYQSASAYFPRLLAIFVAILAASLGFSRFKAPAEACETVNDANAELLGFAKVVVSLLVYTGALLVIGFNVATILFLLAMMVLLGARKPLIIVPVALGLTALLAFLFFWFLGVSPPEALINN